jgi:hypothetical protein
MWAALPLVPFGVVCKYVLNVQPHYTAPTMDEAERLGLFEVMVKSHIREHADTIIIAARVVKLARVCKSWRGHFLSLCHHMGTITHLITEGDLYQYNTHHEVDQAFVSFTDNFTRVALYSMWEDHTSRYVHLRKRLEKLNTRRETRLRDTRVELLEGKMCKMRRDMDHCFYVLRWYCFTIQYILVGAMYT